MEDIRKKLNGSLLQLVTFSIDEEEFGVNILKVQEIIRIMEITRVPRSPEFVEGVINLRGRVIPIVDLRRRFGLAAIAHDKDTRIIVIELNSLVVGFIVDAVSEVLRIPADTVEPTPPVAAGVDSEYISGGQTAGQAPDIAGSGQTADCRGFAPAEQPLEHFQSEHALPPARAGGSREGIRAIYLRCYMPKRAGLSALALQKVKANLLQRILLL